MKIFFDTRKRPSWPIKYRTSLYIKEVLSVLCKRWQSVLHKKKLLEFALFSKTRTFYFIRIPVLKCLQDWPYLLFCWHALVIPGKLLFVLFAWSMSLLQVYLPSGLFFSGSAMSHAEAVRRLTAKGKCLIILVVLNLILLRQAIQHSM